MSEEILLRPDQGEGTGPEAFDHDVHLRPVLWIGVALFATIAIVSLLLWWMVKGFERFDARRDPEPTPIERQVEAPPLPPGPLLQPSPERDLRRMRAEETERLERAAWVDPARGTVRIPIEAAIDAYLAGARPQTEPVAPPQPPSEEAPPL